MKRRQRPSYRSFLRQEFTLFQYTGFIWTIPLGSMKKRTSEVAFQHNRIGDAHNQRHVLVTQSSPQSIIQNGVLIGRRVHSLQDDAAQSVIVYSSTLHSTLTHSIIPWIIDRIGKCLLCCGFDAISKWTPHLGGNISSDLICSPLHGKDEKGKKEGKESKQNSHDC